MTLVEQIKHYQDLFNSPDKDWVKDTEYCDLILRLACRLSSPSKLNAISVLKSNTAEKIAAWLEQIEGEDYL